uniref:Uncharacterized protein n=1 Tax=Steinernema glaseri TaxID=37863 RepID=A0A1I8ARW2_9BILA
MVANLPFRSLQTTKPSHILSIQDPHSLASLFAICRRRFMSPNDAVYSPSRRSCDVTFLVRGKVTSGNHIPILALESKALKEIVFCDKNCLYDLINSVDLLAHARP